MLETKEGVKVGLECVEKNTFSLHVILFEPKLVLFSPIKIINFFSSF